MKSSLPSESFGLYNNENNSHPKDSKIREISEKMQREDEVKPFLKCSFQVS